MEERIYHLNLAGTSGRLVKFRILDPDQVEDAEENGARAAGEDATSRQIRAAQLKKLIAAMVVGYTDPGFPKGGDVTKAKWNTPDPVVLITRWKSVFNTKDTEVLKYLYMEHHEITPIETGMILGKSQPVPTEG